MRAGRTATALAPPCLAAALAAFASARAEDRPKPGPDRPAGAPARAPIETGFRALNRPFEPLRIVGNLYYVGASDIASYLVATPEGHVLIDTGFADTVPMVRANVAKLGFHFEDVKLLLNTHAHLDHAGGHALVQRLTGAAVVMSEADAGLLARGGRGDVLPVGDALLAYEPVKADRIVRDGDTVALGGVTLTAHLTPGHTRGCTTWTLVVPEGGRRLDVVVFGSTTLLPGVRLVGNPKYPGIADDFAASFRTLKSLPCDVFLAPHGSMFGLAEKARRARAGAQPNPFIDPNGYRAYVARSEETFRRRLDLESAGPVNGRPGPPR